MNIFSVISLLFNTWSDKVTVGTGIGFLLFQDIPAPTQTDSWETILKWLFLVITMLIVKLVSAYIEYQIKNRFTDKPDE